MFVRLVVIDTACDQEYMLRYVPCCGGYTHFHLDGTFLGDDLLEQKVAQVPQVPGEDTDWTHWEGVRGLEDETDCRYFPFLHDEDVKDDTFGSAGRFHSRPFLAVILMGATGWASSEWLCGFDDLTDEGRALVESLRRLYPNCEFRLLTFLDT